MTKLKKSLGKIKTILYIAWLPLALLFLFLILWQIPYRQTLSFRERIDSQAVSKLTPNERIQLDKDLIAAENSARQTLAQIIGGLVLLLGLYFTWRNLRVAEEGKITDRFSKSVELLGSDKVNVCLGGIYGLERIAADSQKDHWTVMEVVTAFVRGESHPRKEKTIRLSRSKKAAKTESEDVSTSIQAALTVICRRKWSERENQNQFLDLRGANLAKANLSKGKLNKAFLSSANLNGADLNQAKLWRADLRGAKLIGANLRKANLSKAKLNRADFTDAKLMGAFLNRAELREAKLVGAKLRNAQLRGAYLRKADLSGADLSGTKLTNKAILWDAKLIGAVPIGADFTGANLRHVDFKDAILNQTNFDSADLTGAKNLQLSGAIVTDTTKLPDTLEMQSQENQDNNKSPINT